MKKLIEPEIDCAVCEILCHCGAEYRGKHCIRKRDGELVVIVDQSCPACGEVRPWRASHAPETVTIRK